MIRPCDQCGGSGIVVRKCDSPHCGGTHGEDFFGCPRCDGMPKLRFSRLAEWAMEVNWSFDAVEEVRQRGWFYPDPDSVIRWCSKHDSPMSSLAWERCWIVDVAYEEDEPIWCAQVWVEVPTPLEEAT